MTYTQESTIVIFETISKSVCMFELGVRAYLPKKQLDCYWNNHEHPLNIIPLKL